MDPVEAAIAASDGPAATNHTFRIDLGNRRVALLVVPVDLTAEEHIGLVGGITSPQVRQTLAAQRRPVRRLWAPAHTARG